MSALENVSGWEVGQLAALVHKLGADNARKLLTCNEVTLTFSADSKTAAIVAEALALKVWRTLKLGTGLADAEQFHKAVCESKMHFSNVASHILGEPEFTIATEPTEVDLVIMSVKDLGFKRSTRYDAICARAKKMGLALCPPEVGPQLRLQYLDQPKGEWLVVAMKGIRASDGDLYVFRVVHDVSGRWFGACYGGPNKIWNPDDQFVFVSRNKTLAA